MQNINLYLDEFKEKRIPYSADAFVFSAATTFMFGILLALALYIIDVASEANIAIAQENLTHAQNELVLARKNYPQREEDPRLMVRLNKAKAKHHQNTQLLTYLQKRNLDISVQGFASVLEALSTIQLSDLWLTEIHIGDSGQSMKLVGKARRPNSIPEYVNQLSQVAVFKGMQFKVFDLDRDRSDVVFILNSEKHEKESDGRILETISQNVQSAQTK